MSHRLFVALRPPPEVRERLLSVMAGIDGARWQSDQQLHLTLAFLGTVDGDKAEAVAEGLHHIEAPALTLHLGLFGTFPGRRSDCSSVLYIGVEPVEPLARLASRIRRLCRQAGVAPVSGDGPARHAFMPHITLARFSGAGATREQLAPFLRTIGAPPARWTARRFYLVESFMGASGSHYEAIASYRLSDAAGPP